MNLNTFQLIKNTSILTFLLGMLTVAPQAWSWGRQGHKIVGETASLLIGEDTTKQELFKAHSFDVGYYCNVPDFIWKRPATYSLERPQHYMHMEVFEKAFQKQSEIKNPFTLSRKEFEAKFPDIKVDEGRSLWRIQEITSDLEKTTGQLKTSSSRLKETPSESETKEHHQLQGRWLIQAGALCHYVGDLAQPLHVTENYDGALTHQKGIHSYFEEELVNELYPQLSAEVMRTAKSQWRAFQKKHATQNTLELIQDLITSSRKELPRLLKLDQPKNRASLKTNAKKFHALIQDRLTQGALTLAELYRRNSDWRQLNNKFYFFAGEPEYIQPPSP